MLHTMFYSLTFLSQHVDTTTCPRCVGPDHGKGDCALASLESEQEYQKAGSLTMQDSWDQQESVFAGRGLLNPHPSLHGQFLLLL